MKRRLLLEVDVDDNEPGAMLAILNAICSLMEKKRDEGFLIKYGLDLVYSQRVNLEHALIPIETLEAPKK